MKVWLHLPAIHLALLTFTVTIEDAVWKLIWYCAMSPLGLGHASPGSIRFWRERLIPKYKLLKEMHDLINTDEINFILIYILGHQIVKTL